MLGTNNQFNQHDLDLDLFSILQLSSRISSLSTPGSSFTFTGCQFFLIITPVLLFLVGLVAASVLATADVIDTELTEVSGGWFAM